jgi:hypothetical protein
MRKFVLLTLSLFVMQITFGQLSGTKTIPGDYATIEAAVAALNSQGVGAGGVTFNVAAGHTETITAPISMTATGTVANPVIFQKSGAGANPLITAYVGTFTPGVAVQDGIWNLVGSDYTTIDGIDLYDPNSTNPATMEYGYALFKAAVDNGCQYNTIKNCVVTMSRENNASGSGPSAEGSKAINVANALVTAQTTNVTPTVAEGTNSYNMFYSNTLQNCNYGIVLYGYAAATPFTLGDTGNDIGGSAPETGNSILNFGGAAGATNPSAGVRATQQWGVNISYNVINNNNGSGANHPSTLRGIYAQSGVSANANINNNALTIKGGGTTSQVAMIENVIGSTAAGNTVNINNNTLTGDYLTATSGVFYGLWNSSTAATVNISGNNVSNLVYSTLSLAGSGAVYPIYNSGAATAVNISNNTVNNITRFGTTGGTTIGIYVSSGTSQTVTGNTVSNMSIDGTGSSSTLYGIQTATGTIVVNNNQIFNLACIKTTGTGGLYGIYDIASPTNENYNYNTVRNLTHNGTGIVYGIYAFTTTGVRTMSYNTIYDITGAGTTIAGINNASSSPSVFNNKLYNIQSTSTGAPTVSGIIMGSLGTAGVANVYNNLIGDIKAPFASSSGPTAPSVRGINVTTATTTSTVNISFNTVHLNAVSAGANFSTAGLFVTSSATATTAALSLRNNIIINKSAPAGTGLTVAYQRSSADLANYATASDNNLFYAGAPDATKVVFYNGTTSYQTLDAYKTLVAPRDAASITENANFVSLAGASADFLHVDESIGTQLESGGVTVSGITTDFDNETRNVTTPDIGADEFDGMFLDMTPPSIVYTPLINISAPAERTLTTTITDASGVPTAGIGLPVLYWRINAGAYVAVTAVWVSGNTYTFTFGAGAVIGDVVYYYVAAQDMAPTPNCTTFPLAGAGGFTINPPAAATPPTTPSSYHVNTPLSGTYTVGLALFNSVTGKDISFKKSVKTVMKEVDVEVFEKGSGIEEATETAPIPTSKKQWLPVEEITWIPMDNGQPYTGELFVQDVQLPGFETRETFAGIYATITAAIADLNVRGVSGPVTFVLTDATYPTETFPIVVNIYNDNKPTATNFVTIKPNTGVTTVVSGASPAGQIFKILDSHFVIDGSNMGGSDRSLTLENTSTTTPQVVVIGSTGTMPITNVTVKNCNIINGATSSSALIVSDGTTPGSAGYFSNITIQNNTIQKAYIGAYCNAVIAAGNGNGLLLTQNDLSIGGTNQIRLVGLYVQGVDGATLTGNVLGNMAATDASNVNAIWFATGTVNSSILNNTIATMSGTSMGPRGIAASTGNVNSNLTISGNTITTITTSASTPPYGIYIYSSTGNVAITGNRISGLLNTNTGGYGARGINLLTAQASSNILLANNVIYDIVCTGDASSSFFGIGIAIDGTMGGVSVYHNSVNLYGSFAGYTSGTITAAFFCGSTTTALDVRNNIFVNSFDNTTSATDKAYAIYSAAANTAFTDINYNDYFVSGPTGILGYLGSDRLTLADWQTATGKDANSKNADPLFAAANDLHPSSTEIDNQGTYLANVLTDFDGVERTNPPDMGAYEFGTNPVVETLAASGIFCAGGTINGSINANGLIVDSYFDYGPTVAYGSTVAGTPATVTGTTATPVSAIVSMPVSTTWHYRLRGVTSAGVTVYGDDFTITSADPGAPVAVTQPATFIASYSATLNGSVNASCSSTTVYFEYGLTNAYGATVPADQSPLSGSDFEAVSAPISGLLINTPYHFRVVATNDSGTSYGADQTFETGASPPDVITEAASNIGNFTARLNGSVDANNQNSTVWFEYGTTMSYGSTISGIPGVVTGDIATAVYADISGLAYNTTYHFRVVGQNPAGITYGNNMMFTTLCPVPEAAGVITGPVSVCQSTSGHVYSVPAINYAYNGYVWTVPAGGTITAGAGTNSITVSYSNSAVSGNVTVYGTSICGNGAPSSLPVTINPLPVPVISGPIVACITNTYTYSTATGMTGYVWTVSSGGQIMSGAGTHTITVKWNSAGSQFVAVTYTSQSGCPAAAPTTLNVSVGNLTSPTIAGSELMCVNSGWHVYTTQQGFSNYVWTVTSGGTIVSGQGTYQIEVNWTGAGAQSVSVNYANTYGCSASTPTSFGVTVMGLPGNAGSITGTHELCAGTMGVTYSVNAIPNTVNYVWTLPAGATIIDGANTNSIKVDFALDAISGDIRVQGENLCGTGQMSPPYDVTVNPIPATPVVTVDDFFMLNSSAPEGNQWYFNGTMIEGATGQNYQAEEEGFYWTIVTLEGCVSDESNHIEVIFVGLNDPDGAGFSIYPVPNNGNFVATMVAPGEETFTIMVYNDLGMKMYEQRDIRVKGKVQHAISLDNPATGIYTVIFIGKNQTVIRKILVTI